MLPGSTMLPVTPESLLEGSPRSFLCKLDRLIIKLQDLSSAAHVGKIQAWNNLGLDERRELRLNVTRCNNALVAIAIAKDTADGIHTWDRPWKEEENVQRGKYLVILDSIESGLKRIVSEFDATISGYWTQPMEYNEDSDYWMESEGESSC